MPLTLVPPIVRWPLAPPDWQTCECTGCRISRRQVSFGNQPGGVCLCGGAAEYMVFKDGGHSNGFCRKCLRTYHADELAPDEQQPPCLVGK